MKLPLQRTKHPAQTTSLCRPCAPFGLAALERPITTWMGAGSDSLLYVKAMFAIGLIGLFTIFHWRSKSLWVLQYFLTRLLHNLVDKKSKCVVCAYSFFARKQYALACKPPVSILCLGDGGLGKLLRILLRSKKTETHGTSLSQHSSRSSIQIEKYVMLKHHIPVSFKETPMRLRSSGHLESLRWQNLVRWPNARSHKMLALLIKYYTTQLVHHTYILYPDAKWHAIVLGHRFVSFSKCTKFPTSGAGNSNSSTAVKRSCQE